MPNRAGQELPAIVYVFAMVIGLLLFTLFGEKVFGVKPNPIWIAGLVGFLFALATVWMWRQWRNNRRD